MTWAEVRQRYPNEWVLVEATKARSEAGQRIPEALAVLEVLPDATSAWQAYSKLHKDMPGRELFPVHTSKADLEIKELYHFGVRSAG
jgi:hypothetical protein